MVAERLQAATAGLTPPYAVVDLDALDPNHSSNDHQSSRASHSASDRMDVDAALRVGPLHLGVRRSPVHSPGQAYALAAEITRRPVLPLTGLMFYDAQIAGLPDSSTGGPYGQAPVRTRAPRPASGGDRGGPQPC